MSYTYLRGQGVESSAECFSDIAPSVLSRLTNTVAAFSFSDNETACCPGSLYGMTCAHSTAHHGEDSSTASAADSHVKTSALPEQGAESTASGPGCGLSTHESFARYDRDTCSWKTRQRSLVGGLVEFSETWPRWGSMRNGESFQRKTPSGLVAHRQSITSAKGYGYSESMPTPTVCGNHNRKGASKTSGDGLATAVKRSRSEPTPTTCMHKGSAVSCLTRKSGKSREKDRLDHFVMATDGGSLNPMWVEWLMGWPIGWTDLNPLEMDRSQWWQHSHGVC